MRYLPITLIFALLLPYHAFTQNPFKDKSPLSEVEKIQMPELDNEALRELELARRAAKEVPEFAKSHKTRITPQTHGNWEIMPDGTAIWRLRIYSKNARSLNFGFTKYFMPEGGQFFIYSIDRKDIKGPFTVSDNEEHEQLWTPIILGEESVLEVQIPEENRTQLALNLAYVNHDFMGFGSELSQDCHLDVNCGTEDGWEIVNSHRDIVQSVSMYSIRGVRTCTGFLINNARQDCTPYYMSASHCGVSESNAPSIVAYWNYENPTCRTINSTENGARGSGSLTDFNTGAIWRAENPTSDMLLLELDDPISESAEAYFAGWNVEDKMPDTTICIHHPNTEEKRISFSNQTSYTGLWTRDEEFVTNGDHLIVPDWDIGSTEVGSSGAPLFNTAGQVIGQLHGGAASCRNDDYDSFGRMFNSWADGITASTRLQNWLDPDQLGLTQLGGFDQSQCDKTIKAALYRQSACVGDTAIYQLSVESAFAGALEFSVEDLATGIGFDLTPDSLSINTVSLRLFNFGGYENSEQLFQVVARDDSTQSNVYLKLIIFGEELDLVSPLSPKDSARTVSQTTLFVWEQSPVQTSYHLQLATEETFENLILDTFNIAQNTLQVDFLAANTTYYWRVRAFNKCSIGEWSDPSAFTTASCQSYFATEVPVAISSGAPRTYTSKLKVPEQGTIADVNVITLRGTHRWISDMEFTLISPAGTEVNLINRPCFDEEDFDIQFDDESPLTEVDCPITTGDAYVPAQPLSRFDSELMQGEWILQFRDNESQDGGNLQTWGIEVCQVSEQFDISIDLSQDSFLLCEENEITFSVVLGSAFQLENTTIILENLPSEIDIDIDFDTSNIYQKNINLNNLSSLADGMYRLAVLVSDGVFSTRTVVYVEVLSPPVLRLLFPRDEAMDFKQDELIFEWETDGVTNAYRLEIASDSLFSNIVDAITTASTFYSFSDSLEGGQTYFWRVSAGNDCGNSVSSVSSFTTETIVYTKKWKTVAYKIYPNPSTGLLFIETDQAKNNVEVYASNGQLLQKVQISASATLDLSSYSKGVYLLKLVNQQGVILEKIVLD